ncbi:MAG: ABC-type transport system, multidrug-familypermease [Sedimentibacter sp.]|jgi:fluoroquinolone transport system permease protein|nr:ABC-type transport system, multidrug-familypermease [Sedimentibacter sp.]
MRIINLIKGDIRFQFKYGFYFVYAVFTAVYIALIFVMPLVWRERAAAIMVFSDPAAMGLFFMGAIVLLEKSERVLNSIAVSPVKTGEYILSKVMSLMFISVVVGITIILPTGTKSLFASVVGIAFGSAFFTLCGLIVAANISSLNQFLTTSVPIEIISFLPPIFYLFGYDSMLMLIHPGCIIISLISGNSKHLFLLSAILSMWLVTLYFIAHKYIRKMFQNAGGVSL